MGKYFNYYKTYKKKPKMTRYRLIKNKKVTGSLKNTSNTINLPARTSSLTSNRSVSHDLTTAIDSTNSPSTQHSTQTAYNDQFLDFPIEDQISNVSSHAKTQLKILNDEPSDHALTEELLCAQVLSIFFAGDLTISALKIVVEHTKLITGMQIPKKFQHLMLRVIEDKIEYTKVWTCQNCSIKVQLSTPSQRTCPKCSNRYKYLFIY